MLSPDIRVHTRSIYTIWDLLGDIGGLFDMLKLMQSPFVTFFSFLFGIGLETHLVQAMFKVQKTLSPNPNFLEIIQKRKKLKIVSCNWLFNKRNKRLQDSAIEKISQELDIVHLLKNQMITSQVIRLLFTKLERVLLRNQAKQFVIRDAKEPVGSDDDIIMS